MTDLLLPLLLVVPALWALRKREDVYGGLLTGGREGLTLLLSIAPPLVMLLSAVHLLRAGGSVELLTRLLSPVARLTGLPVQTLPLVLLRPFSGSAALAVGADLMATYGPDSPVGRTAAIMLGGTETTFYTISVYFGAVGVKKTRWVIPAALIADFTGFFLAALTARWRI